MDSTAHRDTHEYDRRILGLGVVDVLLLTGLVLAGQLQHGTNPLENPVGTLEAVFPFVFGWVVVALLAGLYGSVVRSSPTRVARVTAIAWLAGANVALIVRSSPVFDGGAAWPFNLIMTALGLLFLVGWRVGYTVSAGNR